jgi:hypothetical protein
VQCGPEALNTAKFLKKGIEVNEELKMKSEKYGTGHIE